MKFLIISTCILFVCNYCKFSYFLVLGIRESRIRFLKKYSFLDPNHRRILKEIQNEDNVYDVLGDSCRKSPPLYSTYSEYLRDNQVIQIEQEPKSLKNILSIETSFDDTCIAVVRSDGKILSDKKLSQEEVVKEYGGIKPVCAKLEHIKKIESLTDKVIEESGLKIQDIDEIAVTRGPGTELCLRVGYNYAKELSEKYKIPLVSENHIAGHCLSPLIDEHQFKYTVEGTPIKSNDLKFPYLCLLLSGGHSQIYLVENPSKFHLMCETQDEFVGNVLDKCAKLLGLDLSKGGGAELEKIADEVSDSKYKLTIPNKYNHYMEFCFSGVQSQLGLKTEQLVKSHNVEDAKRLPRKILSELAYGLQSTVFEGILIQLEMSLNAVETLFPINQLALVGGVASNDKLKKMILDLFYLRDESVRFSEQEMFLTRTKNMVKRYCKIGGNYLTSGNPYYKFFQDFVKNVTNLEDFIYYLCNPELYPEVLVPGYIIKIGKEHKRELYKSMLCTYFDLIGLKNVFKIKHKIGKYFKSFELIKPSKRILNLIENDSKFTLPLRRHGDEISDRRWDLYTTSKKYCTDNAVMIGFSLIQKNRMGIKEINSPEKINGKDVAPRWDLGTRKNWELLSDICKLDSLIK
ncbi:glycoprotease, putative [Theileria annulata]|uniref:N(6)-L-threonylcarbamoyladenine synthase n=1 Tax=Theileria annulata TaxID=5874 RepID=Q4U8J6_THEAN|nr:glycoprotease, putative [Theileria annulata]CAI76857.1 glycoprotease, putative [Theileria annulata]|eukprot:XP_953482.1 glycoprotease, putative [Theileria annulata]